MGEAWLEENLGAVVGRKDLRSGDAVWCSGGALEYGDDALLGDGEPGNATLRRTGEALGFHPAYIYIYICTH